MYAQVCLPLCDPMDCSLPGSSVHEIFQARILGRVATSSSKGWIFPNQGSRLCLRHWQVDSLPLSHLGSPLLLIVVQSLSIVRLFATPWTAACQAPLSMRFSRQRYWSGLPFPSSGDLPNPGIEPRSPALQADSLPTELQEKPTVYDKCLIKMEKAVNLHNKVLRGREKLQSHNFIILFYYFIINLLLCLIYKLNFIICMYL